jgi:uncharacterized protein YidB (DUF937 family)
MGLLDQVLGVLGGGGASPIQGVLMNMLGGNQPAGMGGQTGGTGGGLGSLLSSFEQAGLGHVTQSWVGDGPNQPVSPQQLQTVFGDSQIQEMASQSGMAPHDFLSQLSQHLPNVVNGMTPNGRLPDEGTVAV